MKFREKRPPSSKNTSKSLSKRLPNFRPSSAMLNQNEYRMGIKVSNSIDFPPPIIFTIAKIKKVKEEENQK